MIREVVLHIGLHKTGTTSFQAVMYLHRQEFLDGGIDPYKTDRGDSSGRAKHGEIAFAAIRDGVLDERPGDLLHDFDKDACFDETKTLISRHFKASKCDRALFSAETLSLFRTTEEVQRLKSLFPETVTKFTVILVLREKSDWFESYKNQAHKGGIVPSADPASAFYFEDDSWLLDFDKLIQVYREECDELILLDYDPEDMVGQLANAVGVTLPVNSKIYRRNATPMFPKALRIPRLILKRLIGSEDQGLRRALRDKRERAKR